MLKKIYSYYIESFSGLKPEIWTISAIVLINRMGTMVLPYLSVYLVSELKLSIVETGIILLPYGIGAFLGSISGGILTDKIGWKKVKFISLIFTAFFMILLSLEKDIQFLPWLIFFMGYFVELFRPANAASIIIYSSNSDRTKAFGLNRLAINLGMSIGPFLGGFIAYYDYSFIFYVDATTCLITSIILLIKFKLQRYNHSVSVMVNDTSEKSVHLGFYFVFIFSVSLNAIIFFQIFSTIPIYFKNILQLDEKGIGMLFMINGLLIVVFEMILMNYLKNKNIYIGIILGYFLVGFSFLFLIGETLIFALLFIIVLSIGEMLTMPLLSSYISQSMNLKKVGILMGVFVSAYSIAHVFAARLGTLTYDAYGTDFLWAMCALLSIINILLITFYHFKSHLVNHHTHQKHP